MSEHQHPAFPVAEDHKVAADLPWTCGLTKREWFAGQAMKGMLSNSDTDGMSEPLLRTFFTSPESAQIIGDYAGMAYRIADAMLEAGAEPKPVQYRELLPSEKYMVEASEKAREALYALRRDLAFEDLPAPLREQVSKAVAAFEEAEIPF